MPILTRTTRYGFKTDIATLLGVPASAMELLSGETQGFSIDATTEDGSVAVIDTGTPANNLSDVDLSASNLVQSGTSAKVVTWNDGTLHTVAVGQIAQQYDGTRFGILIEPTATNLFIHSQEFDNVAWTPQQLSVSADATTAPNGSSTADSLIENGTLNSHILNSNTAISAGLSYAISVYVKSIGTGRYLAFGGGGIAAVDEYPIFNTDNGTVDVPPTSTIIKSAAITNIGNGWYRCAAVAVPTNTTPFTFVLFDQSTDNGVDQYTGDGTSGLYLWGAQLETPATVASSYIATTTITVSRNPDAIGCATSTYPHSATNGTFILWVKPNVVNETVANRLFALNDGTANEAINLVLVTGDAPDSFGLDVVDGGAAQVVSTTTKAGSASLSGNRVAAFYMANDSGVLAAGGSEVADVTATMPTVTALNLGYDAVTASRVFSGYIYQMTYVPRRMTTVEMQTRTA